MSAVLFQTLAWTGVLIAAVLVLRRPVSRHFGAQAAYALWALPLLRLMLPPLHLPAWMAPKAAASAAPVSPSELLAAAPSASDAALWQAAAATPESAGSVPLTLPVDAAGAPASTAEFDLFAALADWPILEALLVLWLGGAAVFLALRFAAYFSLRDGLLAEGRALGSTRGLLGVPVRLVETPATNAPIALGVLDPVIALPPGFLALHDRTSRDLALAHELAHHRGGDLLVNILVQPLFALHWWNPLGRYGWLALRRDQEAACDARVMARRGAQEKAAYAALIARFAAAPGSAHHAALSAPMACPVLGEKSIIHRLRSLSMSDPTPRRRMAGRALLGAGLLVLPLTASISYAASENVAEAPEAPEPPAPPLPPPPPGAPSAPDAPDAPRVVVIDGRTGEVTASGGEGAEVIERAWNDADGKRREVKLVMRTPPGGAITADRAAIERHLEAMRTGSKAEREAAAAALRAEVEAGRVPGQVVMMRRHAGAPGRVPAPPVMVSSGCKPGSSEMVDTSEDKNGRTRILICNERIVAVAASAADEARAGLAEARAGLEEARAEIAGDADIPEATRKQILETLDAQIEQLRARDK